MILSFLLFFLLPPFHMYSCSLAGVSSPQHSLLALSAHLVRVWVRDFCSLPSVSWQVELLFQREVRDHCCPYIQRSVISFTRGAVALVLLHRLPAGTDSSDYCVLSGETWEEHNFPVLWKLLLLQLWFFQIGMTVYMKSINKYVFVLGNVFVWRIQHCRIDLISLQHYQHW